MKEKEKNKYPWELLDATTIMNPIEILAYHTFLYREVKKSTSAKQNEDDLAIIISYLIKEKKKELEVGKCLQMK